MYGDKYATIPQRISKQLVNAFTDSSRPLTTRFGIFFFPCTSISIRRLKSSIAGFQNTLNLHTKTLMYFIYGGKTMEFK